MNKERGNGGIEALAMLALLAVAAHSAVARAIKSGELVRQPCESCSTTNASQNNWSNHEHTQNPICDRPPAG